MGEAMRYAVTATNISHASENKIHDDAVARKLGFTGGLVPGVEVYAYATQLPVRAWGRAWLEHGEMSCRFVQPLYDGATADVTGSDAGGGLDLELHSGGTLCMTGRAGLGDPARPPPDLAATVARLPPRERPTADEQSLAPGTWLGIEPVVLTAEAAMRYCADVRDPALVYREHGGLAHPGLLLRLCNAALKDCVLLQPWIHTGSVVRNFSAMRVGETMSVRARVADNYDRKGHRAVDLDAVVIADATRVVAHVVHTAIYRLRQLSSGA